jgi:hypothetical protein
MAHLTVQSRAGMNGPVWSRYRAENRSSRPLQITRAGVFPSLITVLHL